MSTWLPRTVSPSRRIAGGNRMCAAFSRAPDDYFDELRMEYESDDGLRVPATVFNSRLNRSEMA